MDQNNGYSYYYIWKNQISLAVNQYLLYRPLATCHLKCIGLYFVVILQRH